MEYIAIVTFLLTFQAGTSNEYSLSRIKEMPKPPKLPDLDYSSLPEYIRHIIAPVKSANENDVNSKSIRPEAKNMNVPKTFGMSIVNDHGFVWNDLTKPGTFYEVGKTGHRSISEGKKDTTNELPYKYMKHLRTRNYITDNANTNKEINELENVVHKIENILSDVVKDSTKTTKYSEKLMSKHNSNEIATIDKKPFDINDNNTDVSTKPVVNAEESIRTPNITEKLMQEIEKAVNDVMKNVTVTSDVSATEDLNKQEKPYDFNSTSEVAKIPLEELQNIFDDIIKNYSSKANPNATNVKDVTDKPNVTPNPNTSTTINVDLEDPSNKTITETTPNSLDIDLDSKTVVNESTTETTTFGEDVTDDVKINDENSDVQDDDEAKNSGSTDDEKGNESNNTLNDQANYFNATKILKQLFDDENFGQLMNETTAKFLEPFIKRLGTEIKNEVATQLQDYFQTVENKNNQSTSNYTNATKHEGIEDENNNKSEESSTKLDDKIITESPDIIENELSTPTTEWYINNSTESNEISAESSSLVKPMPQTVYICEGCKVIFNLNSNVTNNIVNEDASNTNDISNTSNSTKLEIVNDKDLL